MKTEEGFVDFKGHKTHYVVYGDLISNMTPLVVLHGGPGYTHFYLENLSLLAQEGRAVVMYDQLGCGESDRIDDPNLWSVELFVEELGILRKALNLPKINILGQSWGGTLALEYMFTKPLGVEKLILSSPLLDTKLWVEEAQRLIQELPTWASEIMIQHEKLGMTDSFEYREAYAEFKRRHICRVIPYPKAMITSDGEMSAQVYNVMWGPSETKVSGKLANWTALDRIDQITIPTLFMSGKYDEATPKQIKAGHDLVKGSQWVLFEHSSHMANLEEPDKYMSVVSDFLSNDSAQQ